MNKPVFSIVTPTYNRANLIDRVFSSLMKQSFKDFEWIVIDDGSVDNTLDVISEFKKDCHFNIKYIKTENKGKVSALNTSIEYCEGFFYLVFDSDDWCDVDALQVFFDEWHITENKEKYFALSALKRDVSGQIVGDTYLGIRKYGSNYFDRINLGIAGDKWDCFIFDKIKYFKFPLQGNDKYMAPSYLLYKFSINYNAVFIDKVISTVEYMPDGISANNIKHRVASSSTTYYYYKEMSKINGFSRTNSLRNRVNRARFLFHSKDKLGLYSMLDFSLYVGFFIYIKDCIKLRNF